MLLIESSCGSPGDRAAMMAPQSGDYIVASACVERYQQGEFSRLDATA
jgi:hypothetical protein